MPLDFLRFDAKSKLLICTTCVMEEGCRRDFAGGSVKTGLGELRATRRSTLAGHYFYFCLLTVWGGS